MYQVLKRDGKVTDFDLSKITMAIRSAFEAQEKQYHPSVIDFLTLKVTADFEPKIKEGLIAVEDIQSIVATLKHKNIGVIITDHNVDETLAITDRTYLLFEGKILKAGSAEELAADPMVRKVYLGQHFELRRSPTLDKLRKGQPASAAEENPSEEK